MCSITVLYNKDFVEGSDRLLKFRGPDDEHHIIKKGFLMKHYLLSLTGNMVKQPVNDENIYCLFNGEIYNYKTFGDYESDVFSIIQSYKKYGEDFTKFLDGEFAIFLIDFNKSLFFISTDIFGIKPIYYSLDNGFGLCSHESFLESNGYKNIKKLKPNTTLVFDFEFNILKEKNVHSFNLDQYVTVYDEWTENFLDSIKKRFNGVNYDIILPMSSGHDSGGISCALNLLEIPYTSYSILAKEDYNVLQERINLNKNKSYFIDNIDRNLCENHMNNKCELFYYGENYNSKNMNGFEDPGAKGLTYILSDIKNQNPNIKILASGQGSDEIMSNRQNYTFGGRPNPNFFTNETMDNFPWQNFFEGANSSYLKKEESVSGSFGIEGRYPYLDKKVVQSYLNLIPELKNKFYKAPLTNFLISNNYPINNVKQGFNPNF